MTSTTGRRGCALCGRCVGAASQQASEPASQQASEPASQLASKPASQQASKAAAASKPAMQQQPGRRLVLRDKKDGKEGGEGRKAKGQLCCRLF
eukprot:357833-Chlamydomonas_euryale.AAC.1